MPPDKRAIEDVAAELGVDPAFVEKDWYAVQVLSAIAGIDHPEMAPVFCGGTSLTKAYGLLKRFSEDLDFRGHYKPGGTPPPNAWRTFRELVLDVLKATPGIDLDDEHVEMDSRSFKVPLEYQRTFDMPGGLRPHLQVEFSKTQPRTEVHVCEIRSFGSELSGAERDAEISCLSPLETAADKLCALTWRTLKRDRKNANDDPMYIRHLHDLCALHALIPSDRKQFSELAIDAFKEDMALPTRRLDMILPEAVTAAHEALSADAEYAREYEQYVLNMSYAADGEKHDFAMALSRVEALITYLK